MPIVIDFGTSNTLIARWNTIEKKAEIMNLGNIAQILGNNPPLIPSLIYVENAAESQVKIGQVVRNQGLDLINDQRFFRGFKRGIGANIQGFLPELDGKNITFEQVGEWFLNTIIQKLPEKLDSLILTVPVDSFESYRNWLTEVCQNWQVEQIRIIDEPTAAALGYGTNQDSLLLVIDFGGGTIDLSLVELDLNKNSQSQGFILKWGDKLFGKNSAQKQKIARVLAKVGKNLGGTDLDNWLIDYFQKNQKIPLSSLTIRLVERLKIALSNKTKAQEVYFDDRTFETYELSLNRQSFEEILQENNFFEQLDNLMSNLLQQGRRNGVEINDIDGVLVVGGSSQIPAFQTWVKKYFPESKIKNDRPFDAIAIGALQLQQGLEIKDFIYHSYGVRYWNKRTNSHGWHTIIKAGQFYPMTNPVELYLGASVENQPSVELIIGELGAENSRTEVYFDGDRLITKNVNSNENSIQPLNDQEGASTIAQLNPLGNPGIDRLKIQFWIDEQRFLKINVEDLLTNEILLKNQNVGQLS